MPKNHDVYTDVSQTIFQCGIIPVIKLEDPNDAVPLCKALLDGGIFVAEITFRTAAAEESIRRVAKELPEVLVGAGTVLTAEMAERAINAGSRFIVTPGFSDEVVSHCVGHHFPIFPGVSSPSDIERGLSYGLHTLKFFPSESCGGLNAIKSMAAPYGNVKFLPSGGIDETNLGDYMRFDKILACGGSFMVKEQLIKEKNFTEITRLAKNAVHRAMGFSFSHIAINPVEGQTGEKLAGRFADVFGFPVRETSASIFATETIEVMMQKGTGCCGHIGIKSNNVARAIAYFERMGIETDKASIRGTEDKPTFVYLKENWGLFPVHITQ